MPTRGAVLLSTGGSTHGGERMQRVLQQEQSGRPSYVGSRASTIRENPWIGVLPVPNTGVRCLSLPEIPSLNIRARSASPLRPSTAPHPKQKPGAFGGEPGFCRVIRVALA